MAKLQLNALVDLCRKLARAKTLEQVRQVMEQNKQCKSLKDLVATLSDLEGPAAEKARKAAALGEAVLNAQQTDKELDGLLSDTAGELGELVQDGTDAASGALQLKEVGSAVGSLVLETVSAIAESVPFLGVVVRLGKVAKNRWEKYVFLVSALCYTCSSLCGLVLIMSAWWRCAVFDCVSLGSEIRKRQCMIF